MSQQINRNKITIELSANNYYTQLPKSRRDAGILQEITIAPMQIKKLEIFKSYQQHVTDVVVHIDNIDPGVAALWGEGKYIAKLMVHADRGDSNRGFENYFVCYDMKIVDVPAEFIVFGSAPTTGVQVILKSITRTRMEVENNFTYELGGKNGKAAAGFGQAPIQFLNSELMSVYARNYMEEGDETRIPWDMTYTDLIDQDHQIHTTPSNGFKMITDTNFQTLEFFFKHYPIFNTTYDWILDDCNTGGGDSTRLKISDFTWWPSWEQHINVNLSKIINREIEGTDDGGDAAFLSMAAFRYYEIQQLEHLSYYDWVVFYVKHGYPKIWAVDVSSGKPIPMNAWNAIHEEAPVLTPSGKIKMIKNPMYQEYLTFMTPTEIEQSEQYKNVFQGLHPNLEKFTFSNVFAGDVDLHTIVEFKLDDIGELGKYDRLGMGYQILHTYTREDLQPKSVTGVSSSGNDSDPTESQYTFSHSLNSEIIFLVIDKGDLALPKVGSEDAVNVSPDPADYNFEEYDPCASATDSGVISGTDGVGIPGNKSIYDQGKAMYDQGFGYTWGGKTSLARGIDCSGYTRLAVSRAGVGGYPHGTANQRPWCQKHAKKIDKVSNAKAGDILFFRWPGNKSWGHTGIAMNNTQYMHSSGGRKGGKGADINPMSHYSSSIIEIYRLQG